MLLAGLSHELTLRLASTVTSVLLEELRTPKGASMGPVLVASLFGRAWAALVALRRPVVPQAGEPALSPSIVQSPAESEITCPPASSTVACT